MESEYPYTNTLINETSPYLLQHAHNPVNWYPWGDEAFLKAKNENKPLFLSIGYSTCHWCHVMEKEIFEDEEAAALMNKIFVSIKVDREERPDIDNLYMTVSQMLTGSGGWPLNVIMTPDKKPFFTATYIPKYSRNGRLGMMDLVQNIYEIWSHNKEKINEITQTITDQLNKTSIVRDKTGVNESIFDDAYQKLRTDYDTIHGGFGTAPKFPQPHILLFLLKYWKRTGKGDALEMVEKTLKSIRRGGIYDHIGDGFHRYSTDEKWLLPHFEKMLYDQGMLVLAYTEAYQATGEPLFKKTVRDILTYISRDMTDHNGGFYTAEDADSEGKEGQFYLWTYDELQHLLTDTELSFVTEHYNISQHGNFKDEATGIPSKENIVHMKRNNNTTVPGDENLRDTIKRKLFRRREKRVHPYKDDKILTDWNGLMLAAVSVAARVFDDPGYREMAEKNARFIMKNLVSDTGVLLHRYRNGQPGIPGFIDDYAFFIWGLIELYQTTFATEYLESALRLTGKMIELFGDDSNGGFYLNSEQTEKLLIRQKDYFDNAIPAGNSIALLVLIKLARITGTTDYEHRARRLVESTSPDLSSYPRYFAQLLYALDFLYSPSFEIVVTGLKEEIAPFLKALYSTYIPNMVVVYKEPRMTPNTHNQNPATVGITPLTHNRNPATAGITPLTHNRNPATAGITPLTHNRNPATAGIDTLTTYTHYYNTIDNKPTIYVCKNFKCSLPVHTVEDMMELVK